MAIDLEAIESKVRELSDQAGVLLAMSHGDPKIRSEYQLWYSQVYLIVQSHLQERLSELNELYLLPKPLYSRYWGISTYLKAWQDRGLFEAELEQQRGILLAVPQVIKLRALEVAALVTADLVGGELNAARLLLDHGFIRPSGAVAGVALEAHLKLLHRQSNLEFSDRDTILPLAMRLRQKGFITLGDEKRCIAMADVRDKCVHKKDAEPTTDEVEELIHDVDRFTKRVQVV